MNIILKNGIAAMAVAAMAAISAPVSAQLYFAEPNLSTPPVTGTEPELALNLPGATATELRAGLIWHLRVAMNIAALQCDFEPSLLTVSNYNATLAHHKSELSGAYNALEGYFQRTAGKGRVGQRALDRYNTTVYSSFSTVHAQRDFCNVMGKIGREAIFADRGTFYKIAQNYMGEVHKALVPTGEQYFTNPGYNYKAALPLFTKNCWKKDRLNTSCETAWREYAAKQVQHP